MPSCQINNGTVKKLRRQDANPPALIEVDSFARIPSTEAKYLVRLGPEANPQNHPSTVRLSIEPLGDARWFPPHRSRSAVKNRDEARALSPGPGKCRHGYVRICDLYGSAMDFTMGRAAGDRNIASQVYALGGSPDALAYPAGKSGERDLRVVVLTIG